MKSGYVSLVGRPNAGKSTLLNHFAGQKLAIVSDKPQTTRFRIVGVRNVLGDRSPEPSGDNRSPGPSGDDRSPGPSGPGGRSEGAQIVFIDTPGIHKPMHRMNRRMVESATDTLREVDVAVLVVDVTQPQGTGDRFVLDLVRNSGVACVLALNKVDQIRKSKLLPIIQGYAAAMSFRAVVPISALTGDGVAQLEQELIAALPDGEPLFPDDYLTDQTERTLAAELVREKVLHHTHDELPYSTGVVIEQWEEPEREGGLTKIYASILVDSDSQKPIVVGKGGDMIKRIGTEARKDLEEMLGGKVFLDLHVKVRQDWRDDERVLDEMGMSRRKRS